MRNRFFTRTARNIIQKYQKTNEYGWEIIMFAAIPGYLFGAAMGVSIGGDAGYRYLPNCTFVRKMTDINTGTFFGGIFGGIVGSVSGFGANYAIVCTAVTFPVMSASVTAVLLANHIFKN